MTPTDTMNADSSVPQAGDGRAAPPAALLHQLLQQLGVKAELATLQASAAKATQNLPAVQPVDQVRYVLTQVS
jgi:hypothetical protein